MLFNQEKPSSSSEHARIVNEKISEIHASVGLIKEFKKGKQTEVSETVVIKSSIAQNDPINTRISELERAYQEVQDAFAA